jgi:hypothetical protein
MPSKHHVVAWSFDHPVIAFDDEYYLFGSESPIGQLHT